jgi:hypothetical protein
MIQVEAMKALDGRDFSQGQIRLAVSGTYGVGKTTTTEALSIATGIPRTHALTAREILRDLMPGKTLEELSMSELTLMGLRRLEERIHNEAEIPYFISDGSVIHEWVYGAARIRMGVDPGAGPLAKSIKAIRSLPGIPFYRGYMAAYGTLTKNRAKRIYDAYIHLPVEFDLPQDGHRPVSEKFRELCDTMLVDTLEELQIPYRTVGGSVEERITRIIDCFDLPVVRPVAEAIHEAAERVAAATASVREYAEQLQAIRRKTLMGRLRRL